MSSDTQTTPPKSENEGKPKGSSYGKGVLVGTVCALGFNWVVSGSDDRYPIRVEYELARACIDGSGSLLSRDSYLAKQERCLCTLEATMKEVSYKEYKKSDTEFLSKFRNFAPKCAKGRS